MAGTFDADEAWMLKPAVALRAERFGALAYDFNTRRLSFLKTKTLVRLIEELAEAPTARDAFLKVGIERADAPAYERALARLAATGMICRRIET